jgi:hypothetical protein
MEFLFYDWLGTPAWFWLAFIGLVAALTAFDLGILHKEDREMGIAESLKLSGFYIGIALLFGAWVWFQKGADLGMKYYTGFFIEKALSIDNVFVISLIFTYFAIPRMYQYRALLWGIIAVIVLRGIMIAVGAAVVEQYYWVLYIFAAFPDRDRHQDAVRGRQADGRREQSGGQVHLEAHAGDAGPSRGKVLRAGAGRQDRQAGPGGDTAFPGARL